MEDKYKIRDLLEKFYNDHGNYLSSQSVFINALWEELYPQMPLSDPEDSSPEAVLEILKSRCGDMIKIEESCGLFSQYKVTLSDSIFYLMKCPGSYYILPMYKNIRRFHTRMEPTVAADIILEINSLMPSIVAKYDELITSRKARAASRAILRTTAKSIIERLVEQSKIDVPGEVAIGGIDTNCVNVCFTSIPVIHCPLEELEERLIRQFGKDSCNG